MRQTMQTHSGKALQDPLSDLEDDDVPTGRHIRGMLGQLRSELENLRITAKTPQWENMVQEHFLPFVKDNPQLHPQVRDLLEGSTNQMSTAIALTKIVMGMKGGGRSEPGSTLAGGASPPMSISEQIERIIGNSQKPGTSTVGGGTSMATKRQQLEQMTPEQFAAYKRSVLARGGM